MAGARGNIPRRRQGLGQETVPSPKQSTESYPPAADTKPIVSSGFLSSIARTQAQAQAFLHTAIACERARRWFQAVDYYRKLLNCLNRKKFPSEYMPGPGYTQLVFESYYHIGVAFQKINYHREASEEFTYAIETKNIPKTACKVGCVTSSFCQTPVFARRAYAYVKCDKIKEAINDATNAVCSDPSNPDVYCIRALVWSSAKEKNRALHDLNFSFRINSSHVCTLILRGAILKSVGGVHFLEQNKDHEKAFKLCPESANFFDVEDFYSPKMPSFFDKFLWPLNAFHTIIDINLFAGATFMSPLDANRGPREPTPVKPFRCGSAESSDDMSLLRRKAYTKACMESGTIINVKKDSSSSIGSVKKGSSSSVARESVKKDSSSSFVRGSVKKGSSSSVVWESGSEELKTSEVNVAKKKKGGSSTVNWNL